MHTSPVRREPKSLFDFKDLLLSYQALSKISPFYFFNEKKKKKKKRNISFSDINFVGQFESLEDHSYVNELETCSGSLVTQDQMVQTACLSQIKYIFFQNLISRISCSKISTTLERSFLSEKEGQQLKLLKVGIYRKGS